MLNATLSRPYTHVGPLTYSEPQPVAGTVSVLRSKVYIGPHYVANVDKAGPRYNVAGLYYGSEMAHTTERAEVAGLVRAIAARTPWNPKDCRLDCQH